MNAAASLSWQHLFHAEKMLEGNGVALGPLHFHLRLREGDWFAGVRREIAAEGAQGLRPLRGEAPADTAWRRIGSVETLPQLRLMPAFPDRAVVVRPEVPYTILPGERIHFFVGVPISLVLQTPDGLNLLTEPVVRLSKTWFGTPVEGELAYAMRTTARREGERLDFGPARVVCPVRVRNQTREIILFERLCLRVPYLDLYEDPARGLWANESSVILRGTDSWSRVAYARGPHAMLREPKLLTRGRENPESTYLKRAISQGKELFQ